MGLSASEELGRVIAQGINNTTQLKEDVFPSNADVAMLLAPFDKFKITLEVTGTKYTYPTDSFILDHPVYGELDSAVLQLDGGYLEFISAIDYVGGAFSYPGTYVIEGGEITLFTYSS